MNKPKLKDVNYARMMLIQTPVMERVEAHSSDMVKRYPQFKEFVTRAGVIPEEWDSICSGSAAVRLIKHYTKEFAEAYKELRDTVISYNDEMTLEDWIDLESGKLLDAPAGDDDMSLEEWLSEQGGTINLYGMATLLFAVFSKVMDARVIMYFDYGGTEDWYRVVVQFVGSPDFEHYYI
jgi:hypothetical protein